MHCLSAFAAPIDTFEWEREQQQQQQQETRVLIVLYSFEWRKKTFSFWLNRIWFNEIYRKFSAGNLRTFFDNLSQFFVVFFQYIFQFIWFIEFVGKQAHAFQMHITYKCHLNGKRRNGFVYIYIYKYIKLGFLSESFVKIFDDFFSNSTHTHNTHQTIWKNRNDQISFDANREVKIYRFLVSSKVVTFSLWFTHSRRYFLNGITLITTLYSASFVYTLDIKPIPL